MRLIGLSLLLLTTLPARAQTLYRIIDLGEGEATSISDNGLIVGRFRRILRFDGAIVQDAGPADITVAHAVNRHGQVVGRNDLLASDQPQVIRRSYAILVHDNETIDLTPDGQGTAYDINDHGVVVGDTDVFGFVYDGHSRHLLDGLGGGLNATSTVPFAINAHGRIVGQSSVTPGGRIHAFMYEFDGAREAIDLGTFVGPNGSSSAQDVNNHGVVVGCSQINSRGDFHPFISDGSSMWSFETLGGPVGCAEAINDQNQIVGVTTRAGDHAVRAFLFQNGTLSDLNELLIEDSRHWTLSHALDINNRGEIVAGGTSDRFAFFDPKQGEWISNTHAVLLVPIPEPSTAYLALCALAALFLRVAQRQR